VIYGEDIMARGTVSKFDVSRGYGLIRPDQSKAEIFVHGSSVTVAADPPLSLGQIVYYEVLTGPHGRQAVAVRPAKRGDAAESTAV
jgi:cold shock CspA family protein